VKACFRIRPSINRVSSASQWSGVTRNSPRSILLSSTLIEMADNRKQTAKESKGIRNWLKKAMGLGSQSTPQNRPDLPSAVVAPPVVTPAVTVDLEEAAKLRAKYTRFRILVIRRANAGKTTLLKQVCNTTEEPSIYDKGKNLVSYPTYRDIPLIISSSTARSDLEGAILMISAPLDLMTDFNTVAGNPRCSSFIHFQEQPRFHLS